jgi:LysM repeat protein
MASTLGLSYQTLLTLNPGYLQGVVPASTKGNFVVIPTRVASAFQQAYGNEIDVTNVPGRLRTTYTVIPGDNIRTLAQLFQCQPADIMRWNGLRHEQVFVNQQLTVYLPRATAKP